VDLKDFNQAKAYAAYDLFKVENESKNYELKLGEYSGKSHFLLPGDVAITKLSG